MAKRSGSFSILRRTDSKSFRLTLNPSCGLPQRLCDEWYRRSFQHLPDELADHRNPKTKPDAKDAASALIAYLIRKQAEDGSARRIRSEDITVGAWLEKFIAIETSPRTGINASKNRPYSIVSLQNYKSYYKTHIKDDPLSELKMAETEEEDILAFNTRMSIKKLKDGRLMGGTRTYKGVLVFVRMAFRHYQRKNHKWINPFLYIDTPNYKNGVRDFLQEDEVVKLFSPGVFDTTMELAVCAAMFLSGLRRAEISALKPEDLDWHTPKIKVCRAWQDFDRKSRVEGPPKGKRARDASFDPVLQGAIKKLWEENGKHDYVFCFEDGRFPGGSWTINRLPKWIKRAGIELGGREIVPHSARHSLGTMLAERGVSLKHIQDLLGHSEPVTTKGYIHLTEKTIRDIGKKISDTMVPAPEQKPEENKVLNFKVS